MSETKHSPLPWTVEGPDMFGDYNILQPGTTLAVGAIVSNLRPPEEVAANAALLVLATSLHHELVTALETVLSANDEFRAAMPDDWEGDPLQDACESARAVLKKAKQPNLEEPRG